MKWSLSVVGTEGTLEACRGGWGGNRGAYMLHTLLPHAGTDTDGAQQQPTAPVAHTRSYSFSGTTREMTSFLALVG
jgi:hypothetical protein